MESIALLLGMAFVAVNVRACLKLNHGRLPRELQATPDSISAPRGVHLEPREGTAETQQSELVPNQFTTYQVLVKTMLQKSFAFLDLRIYREFGCEWTAGL